MLYSASKSMKESVSCRLKIVFYLGYIGIEPSDLYLGKFAQVWITWIGICCWAGRYDAGFKIHCELPKTRMQWQMQCCILYFRRVSRTHSARCDNALYALPRVAQEPRFLQRPRSGASEKVRKMSYEEKLRTYSRRLSTEKLDSEAWIPWHIFRTTLQRSMRWAWNLVNETHCRRWMADKFQIQLLRLRKQLVQTPIYKSNIDSKTLYCFRSNNPVNQPQLLGLLWGHKIVAICFLLDPLYRLAGKLRVEAVNNLQKEANDDSAGLRKPMLTQQAWGIRWWLGRLELHIQVRYQAYQNWMSNACYDSAAFSSIMSHLPPALICMAWDIALAQFKEANSSIKRDLECSSHDSDSL